MNCLKRILRLTLLTAIALSLAASAGALCMGVGTVTGDALRLRAQPGTSSTILTTVPKGTEVIVLEQTDSNWYKVICQGTEGYMSGDYVSLTKTADAELGTAVLDTGGSTLNLRSGPGTGHKKLTSIPANAQLTITGVDSGWYKTSYNGLSGYVSSDYVTFTKAAPKSAAVTAPAAANPVPVDSDVRAQVIEYAMRYLGTPYVYGANGPSAFDCSSFTIQVYRNFGYSLNRSAAGQYSNGTVIDLSQIQPGDLLLWRSYSSSKAATHVGIYIGNNQYIHASSTGGCVTINDMDYGSNARYLVGVRQILT